MISTAARTAYPGLTTRVSLIFFSLLLLTTTSFSLSSPSPIKVLVTGASGRTGQLVLEALLTDSRYEPRALVRSERSAKKLRKAVPSVGLDQIIVCDLTSTTLMETVDMKKGITKMIVCSSAVPVLSKSSLLLALLRVPWNLIRRKKLLDFTSLRFGWKQGQYPQSVDYEGQKLLVHVAKQCEMDQVVVVGSMGGTDETNFLNSVGKKADGSGNGDILIWKRKGEKYLVESGLNYCIIHPGGLKDTPAGEEEFVLDVDDVLLQRTKRSISRADVANLCVAALSEAAGKKVALDCVTQELEEGENRSVPSAEEALRQFLLSGKTYNYEL